MANGIYSAGVYEKIIDDTLAVDGQIGIVTAGIVLVADKGPLGPKIIRSNTQLLSLYGTPSRDNPSLYTALRYLREGNYLTVTRVINDAEVAKGEQLVEGEPIVMVEAENAGAWGNDITVHFGSVLGEGEDVFAVVVRLNGEDVERFEVSRDPNKLDGYGRNRYIEDVVNKRSKYIRIQDNASVEGSYNQEEPITLEGGTDDTIMPSVADIAKAWTPYEKENEIDVEILINAGFTSKVVQEKMNEVASKRTNCRAILDVPLDAAGDVDLMIEWRNGLDIDAYHSALYGGWTKIYDQYSDREILLPSSGDVAAIYAKTFRFANYWDAPAGVNRGVIPALGVSKVLDQDERDALYVNGINPVTTYGGHSAVVWGQKSLQKAKSALDRMNVVNNIKWLTEQMKNSLHPYIFETNTKFLRDQINYILTNFLGGVETRGGLYAFVVDTESENTSEVIDNNQVIVNVFVQPVRVAEQIRLNVTVSPTGVDVAIS